MPAAVCITRLVEAAPAIVTVALALLLPEKPPLPRIVYDPVVLVLNEKTFDVSLVVIVTEEIDPPEHADPPKKITPAGDELRPTLKLLDGLLRLEP